MDLKAKKITVMGLGINQGGVGVAKFLARSGARVTVTDLKTETELKDSIEQLKDLPITYILGHHREEDFTHADMVIRNPAVPDDSPFLKTAEQNKIPIDTDMGLFFQLCPSKDIIGVTGTKGKSTTSALIAHIFKTAGKDVVLAGNIGISVLDALEHITPTTTVVLELSSWHLEGLAKHKVSPHTAVITNILPDHLNRYKDFAAYAAAKALILKFQKPQDIAVLNADSEEVKKLSSQGKTIWYSSSRSHLAEQGETLPGVHNQANIAAATAVARAHGVDETIIAHAITTFKGLPHRMELIGKKNGIQFINDSAATNPSATVAALQSLHQPIFLIMGGQDKNLPMDELARVIANSPYVQKVLLLTHHAYTASEKLMRELENLGKESMVVRAESMEHAVQTAWHMANSTFGSLTSKRSETSAHSNPLIILSPGAASFGMFINEFDRGNKFKKCVNAIS